MKNNNEIIALAINNIKSQVDYIENNQDYLDNFYDFINDQLVYINFQNILKEHVYEKTGFYIKDEVIRDITDNISYDLDSFFTCVRATGYSLLENEVTSFKDEEQEIQIFNNQEYKLNDDQIDIVERATNTTINDSNIDYAHAMLHNRIAVIFDYDAFYDAELNDLTSNTLLYSIMQSVEE